ncbi:MAG: hypothetical protein AABW79_03845 [Nanoarchaeota archaeon]
MFQNKPSFVIISLVLAFLLIFITLVGATDIATIEADIIDVGTQNNNTNGTSVSIQVPDYIDLGNVDENGLSDELKIYVNNTGDTAIKVTPTLISYTDEIFTNLFFREFKTSGGAPVQQRKIGDWSFNISAPSSGQDFKSKYFYMQLDLSDADVDVSSNLNGHQANVRFIATSQ